MSDLKMNAGINYYLHKQPAEILAVEMCEEKNICISFWDKWTRLLDYSSPQFTQITSGIS